MTTNGDTPKTPEQVALEETLKKILGQFVESLNKNCAPMILAQLVPMFINELSKIGGPVAGHLIQVLQNAATGGWSQPVKVHAVTEYDLEDPENEKYAEKTTTPAQILQDIHDAVVRHMHATTLDEAEDCILPKKRSKKT